MSALSYHDDGRRLSRLPNVMEQAMAIELTKEQLAKVRAYSDNLRATSNFPEAIHNYRVNNFRRTLSLDMQSYRPKANASRRGAAITDGKVPVTIVPNRKASARLEARVQAFLSMSAANQATETRPGSLKP